MTISDFVPAEIDGASWEAIEPLLIDLRDREVASAAEFEQWLADRSELEAAISEGGARCYINMTCDTGSDAASKAYLAYVENVEPNYKPMGFELDKKHAALTATFDLPKLRYEVIDRDTVASVEIFRDENVPIQTDIAKLDKSYDEICGAMLVNFDGEEKTLPQMGSYQESTDRSVREAAWRAVADRRLAEREKIDGIYDDMIAKRHEMARNAGFDNYIGYAYKSKLRFDYTPKTCADFWQAVETHVMPFCKRLDESRKAKLGLDAIRPWDLAVDPQGRGPLNPFDGGVDLVNKSQRAFDRLSPELGDMFRTLGDGANTDGIAGGNLMDLDSRKGKAPGGYQYMQDRSRVPFIFMNAAGLHRDVETMVHEAGHAFHSMYCTDEPLLHYRHATHEIAEVASMTMELMTMPYWDEFYPDATDLARARRSQLEGSISLLPWIATIDSFQHWVYANPSQTVADRTAAWNAHLDRFGTQGSRVDWTGLEANRDSMWQRQGHLFGSPFYYIEYGIAQLGALGIWLQSLENGEEAALANYKTALSLGGSRPLPELFNAADLPFDFGPDTVGRLVDRVEAELAKLPE